MNPSNAALYCAIALLPLATTRHLAASENVPHAPFAQWADGLRPGQLIVGAVYQESEAYHFWADNHQYNASFRRHGEHYGIDINQGYLTFQYGLYERWIADLAVGYTTSGWRYFSNFSNDGHPESTLGLMDSSFGIRYQLCRDGDGFTWMPALAFRAGAVIPGTFKQDFPFAPGNRSTAIEPELLLRKKFGWPGLGFYADALFRWNRTTANDQYIVSAGFFQKIRGWELNAGYRHLSSTSGDNIHFDPTTHLIDYPVGVKEISDSVEMGFSYTTKRQVRYGFYSRSVIDGNNTDKKFWLGASVEVPFTLFESH